MKTEREKSIRENQIEKDSTVSSYGGYQYKREYEQYLQARQLQNDKSLKVMVIMAITVFFTMFVVCVSAIIIASVVTRDDSNAKGTETSKVGTYGTNPLLNSENHVISSFGNAMVSVDIGKTTGLTGMVITSDGYVLTSASPQLYAGDIKVNCNDKICHASVVGVNENNGIAILKIDVTGNETVKFGYGKDLSDGDEVYISYCNASSTCGVIGGNATDNKSSSFRISNVSFKDYMYGAAVLNDYGVVIGVVTGGDNSGTEAVYASSALPFIKQHVKNSYSSAFANNCQTVDVLGISAISISDRESEIFGLPGGVMVVKCLPQSLSERSGLVCNDIIIGVDSFAVDNIKELEKILSNKKGETVSLLVYRNERYVTIGCQIDG